MRAPFEFLEEEVTWWDEPALPTPAELAVAPPRRATRPRRPPPRTLAGDIRRLRRALGEASTARLLLAVLAIAVSVAVTVTIVGRAGAPDAEPGTTNRAPFSPTTATSTLPGEAAAAVPVSPADPVLQSGDRGVAVRDLQHALVALGFSQLAPDGAFGEGTAAAVASFQGSRGLLADGVVGAATTAELREAIGEGAAEDAAAVESGLAAAVEAGQLDAVEAETYGGALGRASEAIQELPPGRGATVALVLRNLATHGDAYEGGRAVALFGTLDANVAHLLERPAPVPPADLEDEDGIVHRWFAGYGFQFHPLATFAALNGHAVEGRSEESERLAAAAVARGIRARGTLTWEYSFPFGGPSRWTSALAQAAAAQALARTGTLLEDPRLLERAGAAFRAIPRGLSRELGGGIWVREYGYSDMAILNAQLQSIVSLSEYARLAQDAEAERFVASLSSAAIALLPEFDTGCWSRYSLGGGIATEAYHTYHIKLLRRIAGLQEHPIWAETAERWNGYRRNGC